MGKPRTEHVRVLAAATEWYDAKLEAQDAQERLDLARGTLLKRLTLPTGLLVVGTIDLGDEAVAVGIRQDRCFDIDVLKSELSTRRFNEITVRKVDPVRWDLFSDKLPPELVAQAVTLKPVPTIRVAN